MSFTAAEYATEGEPVELFYFARDEEAWAFTTHDQDITRLGIDYRAQLASRTPFQQSDELNQITTTVKISTDSDLGATLRDEGLSPETRGQLYMRLSLTHANDTEMISPFYGEATSCVRNRTYVEVTVESALALFRRKLLRVTGGVQCPHALYDSGCGVNMLDYEVLATCVLINGRDAQFGSSTDPLNTIQTDQYYSGGIMMYGNERYYIEKHTVTPTFDINFRFDGPVPSYILGQPVKLYAGCDRSYDTCKAKFNNIRNFGGFKHFPVSNPMEGTR